MDSANLLHLATITEVADEDDLPNPNDVSEDLEHDHIECLVEVLQARAKDMRNGQRKSDLAKHAPAKPGWPDETRPDNSQPIQPSLPVPKVVVPLRPPPEKPLPSALSPPASATTPQFRYLAPVESTMDTSAIINQVLSEKVFLSVKELLALSLEVRKYFKETTTTKQLLALPTAESHIISTFSLRADQELWEAAPTLPLRTLDVLLNGTTSATGILDSGCQVVII